VNAIGDSLSDLAISDDGEDGEDEDDDGDNPALGKLCKDYRPSLVMGTISKTVQHRMEHFWQKKMKRDDLTQPGWGDAADYFGERIKKYGTTELNVPAVVPLQMEDDATCSAPTTFGEQMETLDSVPGKSQMPRVTSRPGQ